MRKTVFTVILAVLVAGCLSDTPAPTGRVIVFGERQLEVSVDVAKSPKELALGLMGRSSLSENHGMLFVFSSAAPRAFWMKNTLIPLDIIFISSDSRVLNIEHASPCKSDPCPQYRSKGDAMYVLEVNAGTAKAHGIEQGDMVGLSY